MEQNKKVVGFGFRGWMLIIWAATAMASYVVIGNYPMNILGDLYGGKQTLSLIYTVASVVGIIIQLVLSSQAGKIKSWKKVSMFLGVITIVCLLGVMLFEPGIPWKACFGIGTCSSTMYGTWALSVVIGVWFPRRKGTVMGVATFAFPIINAFLGIFANSYFGKFGPRMEQEMSARMPELIPSLIASGTPADAAEGLASQMITHQVTQQVSFESFMPFLIVIIVGFIIGLTLVTDFPEQCGAYRDNDRSMTPEIAQQMMKQEEINRKTTVWTTIHTLKTPDFWFITIPMGLLVMFAVGAMTQSNGIIAPYEAQYAALGGYAGIMILNSIAGIVGSLIFGLVDTRIGTRKALLIAMVCMVIAGILGVTGNSAMVLIGFLLIGVFMGASSNFTVSAAVQYWRIEDFPSVFSCVNPVANILNAMGPSVAAFLLASLLGPTALFIVIGIAGVLGFVLCALFKPMRVKKYDDSYRAAAGKPLDDALVGRK